MAKATPIPVPVEIQAMGFVWPETRFVYLRNPPAMKAWNC